jgi:hypothetical protein
MQTAMGTLALALAPLGHAQSAPETQRPPTETISVPRLQTCNGVVAVTTPPSGGAPLSSVPTVPCPGQAPPPPPVPPSPEVPPTFGGVQVPPGQPATSFGGVPATGP